MSASPGKSFGLMLPRPSWVAAAAFSLAVHGGVAAMFLRGEPAAPVAGSAVPVEVVIVEGPDATAAASPAAEAAQAMPAAPAEEETETEVESAAVAETGGGEAGGPPPAAEEKTEAAADARATADAPSAKQSAPAADERAPAPPADAGAAADAAGHEPPGPRTAAAEQPRLRPEPRPQPAADRSPDGQGHAKQQLEAAAPSRGAAPLGGNPKPAYPRAARLRGDEGRVVLRVEVLASGEAGAVTVAASSGHAALDEAARDALRHWRFQPALSAGRPVRAVLDVPVRFRLDEGGGPASW